MNTKKIFLRLLACPFVLCLMIIRYTYELINHFILFLRYGGELIAYRKEDAVTMLSIFRELEKKKP